MTTELIKISTDTAGHRAVSGRELHEFLGIETRYNDWFSRMVEYGFVENQDFEAITQKRVTAQGNETTFADHAISIDMAKEICMIQRTDKGKEARRYFIECERQLKEEKLPPPADIQSLNIDNIPIEVPTGIPFSVSRSKTGVITVRVKSAQTPTKAPAPAPPAPQIAAPKPKPKPKKPPQPKGVCLTIPKYAKAADRIVKFLYRERGELITDVIFKDKKIVPWEITYHEYNEILRLLAQKGTIVLDTCGGSKTMTPIRY